MSSRLWTWSMCSASLLAARMSAVRKTESGSCLARAKRRKRRCLFTSVGLFRAPATVLLSTIQSSGMSNAISRHRRHVWLSTRGGWMSVVFTQPDWTLYVRSVVLLRCALATAKISPRISVGSVCTGQL